MPILKPEPADANELAPIVRYDRESAPQGTSRKQQIIGSDRCALAIQACTRLRRHAGIFALERHDGDRIQKGPHGLPHARRQVGISSGFILADRRQAKGRSSIE